MKLNKILQVLMGIFKGAMGMRNKNNVDTVTDNAVTTWVEEFKKRHPNGINTAVPVSLTHEFIDGLEYGQEAFETVEMGGVR